MAVGLKVRSNVWLIGTGDFFFAFFSTIRTRLEPEGWGTRFPVVMNELAPARALRRRRLVPTAPLSSTC